MPSRQDFEPRLLPFRPTPGKNIDARLDVQAFVQIALGIEFFEKGSDVKTIDPCLKAVDAPTDPDVCIETLATSPLNSVSPSREYPPC